MASRSIVDRVLLAAAAACAAGLVWQLTVLVTSKGHSSVVHAVAAQPSPTPAASASSADAAVKPEAAPVRVVYPGIDTPKTETSVVAEAPKSSVKASDSPVAAAAVPPATGGASSLALVTPAEAAPAVPPASALPATPAPSVSANQVAVADPAPVGGAAKPDEAASEAAADDSADAGHSVNINKASVAALNRLHGGGHIGQAIISHRPYKSVDDLITKRVLRRDVVEKIRDQIAAE